MYRYVGGHFRRRRRDWVADEFHGCHSVVDLGGTVESWIGERFPNITVVNVKPSKGDLPTGFSYLQADACDSQLPGGFDLAFSNSAIEHVGTLDRQRQFADNAALGPTPLLPDTEPVVPGRTPLSRVVRALAAAFFLRSLPPSLAHGPGAGRTTERRGIAHNPPGRGHPLPDQARIAGTVSRLPTAY